MKFIRGLLASVIFTLGFITVAGGVLLTIILLFGVIHRTIIPPLSVIVRAPIPGVVATIVGFVLLFLSRALDPDRGPIKTYRETTPRQQMEIQRKKREKQGATRR